MLISINYSSLPSPRTVAPTIKVTLSVVLGKIKIAISSSANALKFSGSITERHGDNSWPVKLVHSFVDTYWC